MKENEIHKLLLSYGLLAMLTVLKELENNEDYDKCISIRDAVNSFKSRYSFVFSREKGLETEEDYINYFEDLKKGCGKIAKNNLQYYVEDILDKIDGKLIQQHAKDHLYMVSEDESVESRLSDFSEHDIVSYLKEEDFNFITEVDEDDMIDYLESEGYIITDSDEMESNGLDYIDTVRLEEITSKFINGNWAEKEEIYSKLINI